MDRYRIFRRGKVWYLEHDATGNQMSLHTRDKREAQRVLNALRHLERETEVSRDLR